MDKERTLGVVKQSESSELFLKGGNRHDSNKKGELYERVYYDEESYPENYLEWDEKWMHPINICDEFWKIDEIYLALVVDAPKDKVRSWFDFCYHNYDKWKPQINFYNYLKLWPENKKNNSNK